MPGGTTVDRAQAQTGTVAPIREALREPGVQTLGSRVVRTRRHSTTAFTQGLALRNGVLYEGTGLYGRSRIERRTFPGGRVTARRSLSARDFGEGVEVLRGRVYQLTWREGRAYVYSARTLRRITTLRYRGEGWGLATDGRRLIMSDGTAVLRFRHPRTFRVLRSVTVRNGGKHVARLNELEYVGGAVLANVWKTDRIAIIDPASGRLEGWIDLSGLNPVPERSARGDVLNGIAFDRRTGRLLVTGKRWPTLFEIVPTRTGAR
ncbi:MAG: glutaminyl-peptide cyclotransferase [Miltoncostaeaceae bacterium]